MQMSLLMSIKPNFAEAIFFGKKQYEFRRKIFKNTQVKKVYVYASSPISMIVGEFEIEKILSADPTSLWEATKESAGISKDYFDKYFSGRNIAHALKVISPLSYEEPVTLKEMFNINRPPQSFMYV